MRHGHKQLQEYFIKTGSNLGYLVKKSFTQNLPTDGVWLIPHPLNFTTTVPLVAIEVIITERLKSIRGSIHTLEAVSPVLAVLAIHEGEIISHFLDKGHSFDSAKEKLVKLKLNINEEISRSNQRFEIWTETNMSYWFSMNKIYKRS